MFGREVWAWKRFVKRFEFGGVLLGDLSQGNMLSEVGAGRHAWTGKREKYLHGRWEYEQRKCDFYWIYGSG